MANYDVISQRVVSLSEVKDIFGKKDELNYRESKVKEYVDTFSKLSFEDFQKAKEVLLSLGVSRLDENDVIKILNIMPKTGTELRVLLSGTGTILVDESVKSILEVLNKYRS